MKILIKDCTLVSMSENREKIEKNVDILINDNKIEKIGNNINDKVDKIINATNKIVMPGLINTHSHVGMSVFRETMDGYTLQNWLTDMIWPIEDNLTGNEIYYGSCLSFIEMIKTGTTTINDMYFFPKDVIRAMEDTGIRLQVTRTLMSTAGMENAMQRLDELQEVIDNYDNSLLTINAGVHALYTCNSEYVDKCIEFAKKNNIIVHMHFCENSTELDDVKKLHGNAPLEILKSKFKGVKTILAHGVKLTEKDIDEIKDMDISILHCPVSNLKLGCGVAKIDYMLKSGINVALGTDGQGTGSNLDMFETMKYTALLQKGMTEDPTTLPAYEVLKMATINGAKALGIDNEVGSIEEGKVADIIIIDVSDVLTRPINNLLSELVYNVKGNNVVTTIVNGKILMEDKKLSMSDTKLKEIFDKCDEIASKIHI